MSKKHDLTWICSIQQLKAKQEKMSINKEEIQSHLLRWLGQHEQLENSQDLAINGVLVDQQELLGVLNSLSARQMVEFTPLEREVWVLTTEGESLAQLGSHEARVFEAIPKDGGIEATELTYLGESGKIGQGKAFKNKWIGKNGTRLVRLVEEIVDQTRLDLTNLARIDEQTLKDLKKRKLCEKRKITTFKVEKGPQFSLELKKQATDLTMEMIQSGAWKQEFKPYNFNTTGELPQGGHLHPLLKVREEFRNIFFELGFEEMPTNRFVESSFWNFDALFQPQQHPARDMHDTFFIKDPATSDDLPKEYLEKVKQVHSKGGYESIGYGYDWKREEAEKLIMRTHTTAISSQMLYKLAQQKEFRPAKYFSVDRVFRNESLDATHLAEFHQVEGLVADRGLTLGDLIGFLDLFFKKMGVSNIKFKPAYNPYTEPSMEIFSYHTGLSRWVEIGNSGMFRPEMLLPLGLPSDVRVIAWGLSLERPTMIKYGFSNIRDLVGPKVELGMIEKNSICR